jgi:YidC/Oxa1 family membrane protein insertase
MKKMQAHKPAIDAINKKWKENPQRKNQEIMAYYKKAGINPLAPVAGCLPMFLQMPIFISLFVVLGRAMELRQAPFMLWIQDLSRPDVITEVIKIPYIMPYGLSLLPFIMALTTFFQSKQSMTDPNMKQMLYIMPIMMFMFSGIMPSGLVLYWIVSNVFTIVQFKIINKNRLPAVK